MNIIKFTNKTNLKLNNVNYYEILEHIRENYEHDKTTEDGI